MNFHGHHIDRLTFAHFICLLRGHDDDHLGMSFMRCNRCLRVRRRRTIW